MSEVSKNEQLIYALLDGELDDVRAQEVRKMLAADRQLSKCHDDCLAQKESLAALPRFTLSEDFSGRVLQAAQAMPSGLPASNGAPLTTERSSVSVWQIATTALLSSAATLLATMFLVAIDAEYAESVSSDDPMVADALADPPIEQVWLLEAQDGQSGVKLARTLAANSIQVPAELSGESDDELTNTLDQEINGILIEASAIQMKKALLELADSEQFEISAFTLPGHEAYFTDIRQAKTTGSDLPEKTREDEAPVASADELAAQAIASAAGRIEGQLKQTPVTMAQQLRNRRFSKKTAATASTSDRKKTLFSDGVYSEADGPEGLGASAAPLFGVDESPAVGQDAEKQDVEKQNVEALFPKKQDSVEPKGNYLLLIKTAPQ